MSKAVRGAKSQYTTEDNQALRGQIEGILSRTRARNSRESMRAHRWILAGIVTWLLFVQIQMTTVLVKQQCHPASSSHHVNIGVI